MQFLLQGYLIRIVVFLAFAALLYRVTYRVKGIPVITAVPSVSLDQTREAWLLDNDYTAEGTYLIDAGNRMAVTMNVYLSADKIKGCGIIGIKVGTTQHIVTEFTSRCIPFFVLCTNDYCGGEVWCYPPYKLVVHSRTRSVEELSQMHDELLDECCRSKVVPAPLPTAEGMVQACVCNGMRSDLEYQVRIGRMKRVGKDLYRPTILGGIIAAPIVWYSGIRNVVMWFLPNSDQKLLAKLRTKLREFWAYPQSAIDYKY